MNGDVRADLTLDVEDVRKLLTTGEAAERGASIHLTDDAQKRLAGALLTTTLADAVGDLEERARESEDSIERIV